MKFLCMIERAILVIWRISKHVKSEVDPKRKLTSKLMDSGEIEYGTVRVKSKKLKSQEV